MKKDLKKVQEILTLRNKNVDNGTIKDVLGLEHDVEAILAEYEAQKAFKTVDEVAEMLQHSLGNKEVWNVQKVYRLMRSGILTPIDSKPSRRTGFRFKVEVIESYIKEQTKTKEDLQQEVDLLKQEKEVDSLKHQQELEQANQRIADLEAELKSLKGKGQETIETTLDDVPEGQMSIEEVQEVQQKVVAAVEKPKEKPTKRTSKTTVTTNKNLINGPLLLDYSLRFDYRKKTFVANFSETGEFIGLERELNSDGTRVAATIAENVLEEVKRVYKEKREQ